MVKSDFRKGLAIGITGGIACGKTEVGRILRELGAEVRDADLMAHEVIRQGSEAYGELVARFGYGVLDKNGEVDRRELGEIVFSDAGARKDLEAIIHPRVIDILREWVCAARKDGRKIVGIVPLLFEVDLTDLWDAVICVAADDDRVLERLRRRGLTEKEALARIAAQMPLQEKRSRADYVIENNDTIKHLASTTTAMWKNLLKKGE